ncbi:MULTISPECIES: hypothetical protein [unclassified Paenibacillus]|uniref:hypothetical protein n=1 Tax=unclassified Paenibacillus TaxID=185978 RepID=UPI00020D727F|nr:MULTISPECIES: hypothetical protein [unclassified Paenibacillus]EGL17476.1 hypothetical protein HMPREF9413_5383 [Paenibacillus sp. HGF7]EPD81289.1 hypothetical protein HMPREF1207_05046 [Paenibacillus sp. HGH0039]
MDDKYFVEIGRKGEIELYERDGAFYDHDIQDLLVATFYDKEYANKVAKLLNKVESIYKDSFI